MGNFFMGFLKLYAMLGHLVLLAIWNLIGLLIYLSPTLIVTLWVMDDAGSRMGAAIFMLVATGLLSIYVKALNNIHVAFQFGSKAILQGMNRMVSVIDNPSALK